MPLTARTPERNADVRTVAADLPDDPWILQEFVAGQEYCTHGTVRNGRLQVYGCCESSAFQINYAHVDKPEIRSWVETFVERARITGQVSFDFIEAADGHAVRDRMQSPHPLGDHDVLRPPRGRPRPTSTTGHPVDHPATRVPARPTGSTTSSGDC